MTKNEKIARWFKVGNRGVSSMSMAYIATGATMGQFDAHTTLLILGDAMNCSRLPQRSKTTFPR